MSVSCFCLRSWPYGSLSLSYSDVRQQFVRAKKKMWTAGTTHGNAGLKADSNALVLPKIARKVSLFACRKRISDAKIREHVSVYLLLRRPAHLALCRKLHGRYHSKPCSEMSSQLYNASWTNTKKHTLRRETVSRPEKHDLGSVLLIGLLHGTKAAHAR